MNSAPPKDQGSIRKRIFALLLVIWLLKLISGLIDVAERHVPSYPNAVRGTPDIGQMEFYVVIPSVVVVLNLLMFTFAAKLPRWLAIVLIGLQFISLLMLLIFSTGGI